MGSGCTGLVVGLAELVRGTEGRLVTENVSIRSTGLLLLTSGGIATNNAWSSSGSPFRKLVALKSSSV